MTFEIAGSRSSVLKQELQTGRGFWCGEELLRSIAELASSYADLEMGDWSLHRSKIHESRASVLMRQLSPTLKPGRSPRFIQR